MVLPTLNQDVIDIVLIFIANKNKTNASKPHHQYEIYMESNDLKEEYAGCVAFKMFLVYPYS